jgi:hypothetical protein
MSEDLLHDSVAEGERARVAIGEGVLKREGWSMVGSASLGQRQGRDGLLAMAGRGTGMSPLLCLRRGMVESGLLG